MLITFLGNEEILLVCCDDGDVIAYFTRHIYAAVERRRNPDSPETQSGDDIRHFFLANVGDSAWGLAVHTQARKIAVSANTHAVNIFAFALTNHDSDTSFNKMVFPVMDNDIVEASALINRNAESPAGSKRALSRDRDQRIILKDMTDNLPCVSFCNTGEDPDGRFLVAGDIQGLKWVWDLHQLRVIEIARLEFCISRTAQDSQHCGCDEDGRNYLHSIWALHWLDKRVFRQFTEDDMREHIVGPLPSSNGRPYDVSSQRLRVPQASTMFIAARQVGGPGLPVGGSSNEADGGETTDDLSDTEHDKSDEEPSPEEVTAVEEDDMDIDSDEQDVLSDRPKPRPRLLRQIRDSKAVVAPPFPSSPLMQISLHDIFLSQPHNTSANPHPIFGMSDPFKQAVQSRDVLGLHLYYTLKRWERIDRNSLSAVIPELGVVIVATPKGRAAILSLCQSRAPTIAAQERKSDDPIYYYRLEWLLPFAQQEKHGERPIEPYLIGIAVGPVQGMLGPPMDGVTRRWRLLLTYKDHTALSYEIGRESGGESGRVEAEALLF